MHGTLYFAITFPLFRFSAYHHVLFISFVTRRLYVKTTGAGNAHHELTKKRENVPLVLGRGV